MPRPKAFKVSVDSDIVPSSSKTRARFFRSETQYPSTASVAAQLLSIRPCTSNEINVKRSKPPFLQGGVGIEKNRSDDEGNSVYTDEHGGEKNRAEKVLVVTISSKNVGPSAGVANKGRQPCSLLPQALRG